LFSKETLTKGEHSVANGQSYPLIIFIIISMAQIQLSHDGKILSFPRL